MWKQDCSILVFGEARFPTELRGTKPAELRRIWNSCWELTWKKRRVCFFSSSDMEFPVTTNPLLARSSLGGDGESEPSQSSGKRSRGALGMGSSGDGIWPEEREGGTRKNSISGLGNLIRRRRNQHNALTIAGQASRASTRGRIEAIREKTVSIFPFFLAVEIWLIATFLSETRVLIPETTQG